MLFNFNVCFDTLTMFWLHHYNILTLHHYYIVYIITMFFNITPYNVVLHCYNVLTLHFTMLFQHLTFYFLYHIIVFPMCLQHCFNPLT